MKTVIEMAREAAAVHGHTFKAVPSPETIEFITAFAELARADEREKYKWDIHSCGPTCQRYACVAMREAVEAEREECAKVCEELLDRPSGYQGTWEGYGEFKTQMTGQECADAIRARSNT